MYEALARKQGENFNVPVEWILAVIQTESRGNSEAFNPEKNNDNPSIGLMQVSLVTARALGFRGEEEELFIPDTNVYYGTKLLGQLIQRYGTSNVSRIYSAYNSGKPDLYRTSSEVAAHVAVFRQNLAAVNLGNAVGAVADSSWLIPAAAAVAAFFILGGTR